MSDLKRIGTADNYAISDAAEAARAAYSYRKTPEYETWLQEVAAWRRCGMDGPQPPTPDLSQGLQEYRYGEPTRRVSVDLWREDLRGLDLRDIPRSTYGATVGMAPMLNVPAPSRRSRRMASSVSRTSSRIRRARGYNALPASVSVTPRPCRSNSGVPICASSRWICPVSDGCDSARCRAARLSDPASAVSTKERRSVVSMQKYKHKLWIV